MSPIVEADRNEKPYVISDLSTALLFYDNYLPSDLDNRRVWTVDNSFRNTQNHVWTFHNLRNGDTFGIHTKDVLVWQSRVESVIQDIIDLVGKPIENPDQCLDRITWGIYQDTELESNRKHMLPFFQRQILTEPYEEIPRGSYHIGSPIVISYEYSLSSTHSFEQKFFRGFFRPKQILSSIQPTYEVVGNPGYLDKDTKKHYIGLAFPNLRSNVDEEFKTEKLDEVISFLNTGIFPSYK